MIFKLINPFLLRKRNLVFREKILINSLGVHLPPIIGDIQTVGVWRGCRLGRCTRRCRQRVFDGKWLIGRGVIVERHEQRPGVGLEQKKEQLAPKPAEEQAGKKSGRNVAQGRQHGLQQIEVSALLPIGGEGRQGLKQPGAGAEQAAHEGKGANHFRGVIEAVKKMVLGRRKRPGAEADLGGDDKAGDGQHIKATDQHGRPYRANRVGGEIVHGCCGLLHVIKLRINQTPLGVKCLWKRKFDTFLNPVRGDMWVSLIIRIAKHVTPTGL